MLQGRNPYDTRRKARKIIDGKLEQSGWVIQYLAIVNPMASLGVAVREYPTSTGPVDYALFVVGKPIGVVEAKKDDAGENITVVEGQSGRYANSKFKYVNVDYHIRFAYPCVLWHLRFRKDHALHSTGHKGMHAGIQGQVHHPLPACHKAAGGEGDGAD